MPKGSRSIGENQRMRRGLPFRKAEIAGATLGGEPGMGGSMDYLDVFKMVFGRLEGFVCLAFKEDMKSKAGPLQTFFRWPGEIEQIKAWVEERRSTNCYFCPHLLSKPIRKKEYALWGHTLYADLDRCQPSSLTRYGEPTFSVIVQTSPGRWQAYWILDQDVSPKQYEALNHRIALGYQKQGCDQGGWPLTKLLRIPGTTHNKGEPFTVEAFVIHPWGADSDGFNRLPSLPSTIHGGGIKFDKELPQMDINSLRVDRSIKQLILNPPDKGDRSEACFKVIASLYRAGYNATEIKAVMKQNPIGDRYYER